SALGIGHGLEGREGFRRNDEKRFGRVEIVARLDKIDPIDIRDEPEGHGGLAVMPQRLVSHHWTQSRTAHADVEDVTNPFPGVSLPGAVSDPVGEVGHSLEHLMDVRDDIFAVDYNRRAGWRA